jgi:hypothetical protein
MDETKKAWYQSKTLWVNVLAVAGIIVADALGLSLTEALAPSQALAAGSVEVALLAVVNIILRIFTDKRITFIE